MHSFSSHIGKLEYLLGVHYIYISEEMLLQIGGIKSGRWICHIKGITPFQCGLVSLGNGSAYITLNKTRLKKLGLQDSDSVDFSLEKDTSEFGMDVCEELQIVLQQDEEANDRFRALKPGMQRYIIHYVSQVKSSQLRIDRAILLLTNLKLQAKGKETFRAMLGK